ncbi:hypothetical protein SAMN05421595_2501 [Austwickia chelonae]|uniref:Peptidase M56 domain-containing protein n=1 Tax=Austwickia chelonae NBRC 105200 TaxID=1184607 RepID=K6UNR8_9MICO|nr:M56 family metallopeptidase [Austwickia chelonae]GAB79196.1 hypothetical protein AUCHE_21_00210 [Austwickia chelonae NBRC 105200]SEW37128.1 hypothetical protein SAMN05421595_2501 [Austwickia chelonae]
MTGLEWIGYPQIVLALWCPLLAFAVGNLLLRRRMPPRARFVIGVCAASTPAAALCVPYLPGLPFLGDLPWRAPLVWGISSPSIAYSGVALFLLDMATLFLLAGPCIGMAVQAVRVCRSHRKLVALPGYQVDGLRVVTGRSQGRTACTSGLFRPVIHVGEGIHRSSQASAVIAHERAHARARHLLWISLAEGLTMAWVWMPGRRRLITHIRLAAELWADEEARCRVGDRELAQALLAQLGGSLSDPVVPGRRPTSSAVGFSTADMLLVRAEALTCPPVQWSRRTTSSVVAMAAAAGLLVVLL